jgi:hypothetical protein
MTPVSARLPGQRLTLPVPALWPKRSDGVITKTADRRGRSMRMQGKSVLLAQVRALMPLDHASIIEVRKHRNQVILVEEPAPQIRSRGMGHLPARQVHASGSFMHSEFVTGHAAALARRKIACYNPRARLNNTIHINGLCVIKHISRESGLCLLMLRQVFRHNRGCTLGHLTFAPLQPFLGLPAAFVGFSVAYIFRLVGQHDLGHCKHPFLPSRLASMARIV